MSHWIFERPKGAAARAWLQRPGEPARLVAPLNSHRRKFGDLYDWGTGNAGDHLLAATILNHCGLSSRAAAYFAPHLVSDLIQFQQGNVWRLEMDRAFAIAEGLLEQYGLLYAMDIRGKEARRAQR